MFGCSKTNFDLHYNLEPDYVLNVAEVDVEGYIKHLESQLKSTDGFAASDRYLILARLTGNERFYSSACQELKQFKPINNEQKAIVYESIASLNCDGEKYDNLANSATIWENMNVSWRARLLRAIIDDKANSQENNTYYGMQFDTSEIKPQLNLTGESRIVIGSTKIAVKNDDIVMTQVDRVFRDWLGLQIDQNPFYGNLLVTFSERLTYTEDELMSEIGWHEGGRMRDLKRYLNITPKTAYGTIIIEKEGKWYAPDDKGVFRFEVLFDKVAYPTTRFLARNVGMIVDTHGVSLLVEQSIRNGANMVLSDCDYGAKTKAALYLSKHNISVICFPDRFVHKALGHNARLVGSPTWRFENGMMIYGDSPIEIVENQTIVVTNADFGTVYALWYYNAPFLYFSEISKTFPLNLIKVDIDNFNQLSRAFDAARKNNASIVGTRVFNSDDYKQAKEWLDETKENKIILFHSTMYPYGIKLMKEYQSRISFDDPNVKSVRGISE
jgi:hypothetical protein